MSSKEEYNAIPVLYCRRCLSLLIKADDLYGDYCIKCGCTNIGETNIEHWEELYKKSLEEPDYGKGQRKK